MIELQNLGPNAIADVTSHRCVLGESPSWQGEALFWTDVNGFQLHRAASAGGHTAWSFDRPVVSVKPCADGDRLLLVLADRIVLFDPATGLASSPIVQQDWWPERRFNDAAIDPFGRLWVGTMRNNIGSDGGHLDLGDQEGIVLVVDNSGQMIASGIGDLGCPNGLAFSPDGERVYWADTASNQMWDGQYGRETGRVCSAKPFGGDCNLGVPDGSAIDEDGFIWNARFGGSCLVRFAPNGGGDRVVELPVTNPTCCCFGGPGLSTLFVTSARLLAPTDETLAGAVLALDVGVSGAPVASFALTPAPGDIRQ